MAAGSTYTPIAAYTLPSSAATYTFSSIPSTYTDLVLVCNFTYTATSKNNYIRVGNGSIDTGTNYSLTMFAAYPSAVSSSRATSSTEIAQYQFNGGTTSMQTSITHFQNYANTNTNKTALYRINDVANEIVTGIGMWRNTAAINTISTYTNGSFAAGTTFTLYGITTA
jgi:hypothetical protein